MQSNWLVMMGLLTVLTAAAGTMGGKRTILTSGETVHTIHYQLGQSTILYFGMKPETVICGNKNYFHIDRIKEGVTIQALGNQSTNLAVLSEGKRFLFYLTPAKGGAADSFIDVRFVPPADTRVAHEGGEVVADLTGQLRLGNLELRFLRKIRIEATQRTILEFELKNAGGTTVKTAEVGILGTHDRQPIPQISVFDGDEIKPGHSTLGRLILTGGKPKDLVFNLSFQGKSASLKFKGNIY